MWFIGVEVEQEASAPPPKKDPGSAPATSLFTQVYKWVSCDTLLRGLSCDRLSSH